MRTYILPESGNLYKVNLHTHSTLSDGAFAPEELKAYYESWDEDARLASRHGQVVFLTMMQGSNKKDGAAKHRLAL